MSLLWDPPHLMCSFYCYCKNAKVSCHSPRLVRQAEPGRDAHIARLVQELDFFPGTGPRMGALDDDFRPTSDASHSPEQPVRADQAELVHLGLQEL